MALALISIEFVALPVMLLLGWSVIAIAATTNTLIQLTVPDRLRGRVMSVYTTVFAGSSPIGGLFAGAIAAAAGVAAALAVGGVVAIGGGGGRRRSGHGRMPSGQGGPRAASQGIG